MSSSKETPPWFVSTALAVVSGLALSSCGGSSVQPPTPKPTPLFVHLNGGKTVEFNDKGAFMEIVVPDGKHSTTMYAPAEVHFDKLTCVGPQLIGGLVVKFNTQQTMNMAEVEAATPDELRVWNVVGQVHYTNDDTATIRASLDCAATTPAQLQATTSLELDGHHYPVNNQPGHGY